VSGATPWSLHRDDAAFPACLLELGDRAPEVIYGAGPRELVAHIAPAETVTIVGARRSGSYGRGVARDLGHGAAAAGLVVVSGLALGCDSSAHEGALDANGTTIAVLGNGPDIPYPRSKATLYKRILAAGGAIVAEQPPGREPQPHFFPARNRIMAAFARLTVIVEGAGRSGTRYTAEEAIELGREVGAVPGAVTSTLAELPNDLLHAGAAVIRDPQDILDLMLGVGRRAVRNVGPELAPELAAVLTAVEAGAQTCDAVALAADAGGRDTAVALARLELMGYLEADAGGRYSRTVLRAPQVD
jgi:DNA processing protein